METFERKTDKEDRLECLTQRIKVLENCIAEIDGDHTETVKGNKATTGQQYRRGCRHDKDERGQRSMHRRDHLPVRLVNLM